MGCILWTINCHRLVLNLSMFTRDTDHKHPVILALRVYAVYNLSRKMLSLLVASTLAAFATSGWIIWRALALLRGENGFLRCGLNINTSLTL